MCSSFSVVLIRCVNDGNGKINKKMTFKRVKKHLEEKYKRKFSFVTVVSLGQLHNKRRKSAARYKCLANVVRKRARKGFKCTLHPRWTLKSRFICGTRERALRAPEWLLWVALPHVTCLYHPIWMVPAPWETERWTMKGYTTLLLTSTYEE